MRILRYALLAATLTLPAAALTVTVGTVASPCSGSVNVPFTVGDAPPFVILFFNVNYNSARLTFLRASVSLENWAIIPSEIAPGKLQIRVQAPAQSSPSGALGMLTFALTGSQTPDPIALSIDTVSAVLGHQVVAFGDSTAGSIAPQCSSGLNVSPQNAPLYVSHLAGSTDGYGSRDGPGSDARFGSAFGIAVDDDGTMYVSDASNFTIRRITTARDVSTLAGRTGRSASTDGNGSTARFVVPRDLVMDRSGVMFLLDGQIQLPGTRIRRITRNGDVTTIAGTGTQCADEGLVSDLAFCEGVEGIAVGPDDTLYVLEQARVRRIAPNGQVTVLAGGTTGFRDGTRSDAQFHAGNGDIAVGPDGNVYVYEPVNRALRRITAGGVVTTVASGDPFPIVSNFSSMVVEGDGTVTVRVAGQFVRGNLSGGFSPYATFYEWADSRMALTPGGSLALGAGSGALVEKLRPDGVFVLIAGQLPEATHRDGTGSAARFAGPYSIAYNAFDDSLYIADGDCSIRKVSRSGIVTTLNTSAHVCAFALRAAPDGSVVALTVAEPNRGLSRIGLDGSVTQIASLGNLAIAGFTIDRDGTIYVPSIDGIGTIQSDGSVRPYVDMATPYYITIVPNGEIIAFIGYRLVRVTRDKKVLLLAGRMTPSLPVDGTGSNAAFGFGFVNGIAAAPDGSVYVLDSRTLRRVDANGTVTTLAGGGIGSEDGPVDVARFSVAVDLTVARDDVYIAELAAIRRVSHAVSRTRAVRH